MKKILVAVAILLGSEQLLAQTLPLFDTQKPDCVKITMEKTDYKTEEKAKAFCRVVDAAEVASRRN
jgi:hypothetical protein